jgi:hypothetical protein
VQVGKIEMGIALVQTMEQWKFVDVTTMVANEGFCDKGKDKEMQFILTWLPVENMRSRIRQIRKMQQKR